MTVTETYKPSDKVIWLHGRTRFTASFEPATNEFPSSLKWDGESREWMEGCVTWGGAFALLGLVLSGLFLLGYIISLCCCFRYCSAKKKDAANMAKLSCKGTASDRENASLAGPQPIAWAYNRKLYLLTLGSGVVFLLLALTTFYPVTAFFDDGVNRSLDGIDSARALLQRLIDVANQVIDLLSGVEQKTRDIADDVPQSSDVHDFLIDFANAAEAPQQSAEDGIVAAEGLEDRLRNVVSDGRDASDTYATKIAFTYVGILCFSMLIFLVTLIPWKLFSCPYKAVGVPLNLVFLFLLWTFTGIYLVIGLMSADYCMRPNENTIELFESSAGPNSKSTQSVRYYLSCDPTSPERNITKNDGVRYDVRQTVVETENFAVDKFEETVRKIEDEADSNAEENAVERFKRLNSTLQDTLNVVRELDDIASCSSLRATWDIFVDAFCDKFINDGIITLFGIQTFMAVTLTAIMGFGWSFCIRHPSRTFKNLRKQWITAEELPADLRVDNQSAGDNYLGEHEAQGASVVPPRADDGFALAGAESYTEPALDNKENNRHHYW
eukprot:gb/GECG01001241.1/.p1 GENE.gb/GECG01001241.1/~~gb/GECG01001241.1/.p1  ORF type:complete len:554 (+),score=45.86 gb/GECG01001241.1/:1-1662(+)